MSYNGWTNWATWACTLHFQDTLDEIFNTTLEQDFLADETDMSYAFQKAAKETINELVDESVNEKPVADFPPESELFNHVDEIDFYDIFNTMKKDCKAMVVIIETPGSLEQFGGMTAEEALEAAEDELRIYLSDMEDDNYEIEGKSSIDWLKDKLSKNNEVTLYTPEGKEAARVEIAPLFEEEPQNVVKPCA